MSIPMSASTWPTCSGSPGITDPDKFHELIRQQSGMSYEDFRRRPRINYLTREVIGEEVGRHINITDKEIEDYYNAHK